MGNIMFDGMTEMINAQIYSSKDVIERMMIITTYPNDTWATRKKGEMHTVPKSYFK